MTTIDRPALLTTYTVEIDGYRLIANRTADLRVLFLVTDPDGVVRGTIARIGGVWVANPPHYVKVNVAKLPEFSTPEEAMINLMEYQLLSF